MKNFTRALPLLLAFCMTAAFLAGCSAETVVFLAARNTGASGERKTTKA